MLDKPRTLPAPYKNGTAKETTFRFVTSEQYLARERVARTKHEYIDGKEREMAGASRVHNLLTGKIITVLTMATEGQGDAEVYPSDMRVRIPATSRYTYPDVIAVVGEEPRFTDDACDTVLNPTLIVEVLSPGTQDYDRGDKFDNYKTIASLREYVLVSQTERKVEVFTRDAEGGWSETTTTEPAASVIIPSLGVSIVLADLYRRVPVSDAETETPA